MSAASAISDAYGEGACLYEAVLCVSRTASPSELRRAYYKKCLLYHPDKLSSELSDIDRDDAKCKFRAISVAYSILSNDESRRAYDECGALEDENDDASNGDGVDSWKEYFDAIFPRVTKSDIDAFELKYKCSDEEMDDVLKYYVRFGGDVNKMLECVMLSSEIDVDRWVKDYIRPAIVRGDVEDHMPRIEATMRRGGTKDESGSGEDDDDDDDHEGGNESDTPVATVVGGRGGREKSSSKKKMGKSSTSSSSPKKGARTMAKKKKKKSSSAVDDDDNDDLVARIRGNALARGRREGFDSLMAGLEERYGGGGGGGKGGRGGNKRKEKKVKGDDVMDDDEFAKIQARIMKNKEKR